MELPSYKDRSVAPIPGAHMCKVWDDKVHWVQLNQSVSHDESYLLDGGAALYRYRKGQIEYAEKE